MGKLGSATLEAPMIEKGTYIFDLTEVSDEQSGDYGPYIILTYEGQKIMGDESWEDLNPKPKHREFFSVGKKIAKGSKEYNIATAHMGREPEEGEEIDDSIFTLNPRIKGTIDHVKAKQSGKINPRIVSWQKVGKYTHPVPEKKTGAATTKTSATEPLDDEDF